MPCVSMYFPHVSKREEGGAPAAPKTGSPARAAEAEATAATEADAIEAAAFSA